MIIEVTSINSGNCYADFIFQRNDTVENICENMYHLCDIDNLFANSVRY